MSANPVGMLTFPRRGSSTAPFRFRRTASASARSHSFVRPPYVSQKMFPAPCSTKLRYSASVRRTAWSKPIPGVMPPTAKESTSLSLIAQWWYQAWIIFLSMS